VSRTVFDPEGLRPEWADNFKFFFGGKFLKLHTKYFKNHRHQFFQQHFILPPALKNSSDCQLPQIAKSTAIVRIKRIPRININFTTEGELHLRKSHSPPKIVTKTKGKVIIHGCAPLAVSNEKKRFQIPIGMNKPNGPATYLPPKNVSVT